MDYMNEEYQISFSYPTSLLEEYSHSITFESTTLEGLLKELSEETSIELNVLSPDQILLRNTYRQTPNRAQKTIHMKIVDIESNEPLELVAINIRNTNYGVYTNQNGEADLRVDKFEDVPIADFYMLGYEPAFLNIDKSQKNVTVGLKSRSFDLNEVEVVDTRDLIQTEPLLQATILNTSDIIGSAGSPGGNDIIRQIQLLAGVRANNDASSGISIRGGKEDQTLIILDGIPIYNASHYHGVYSAISPSYASKTSLFKNNIPIQYGGKTSGMVQIESSNPSEKARSGIQLDINALTASINVQAPINNKLGLMLGGRTSYSNASESVFSSLFASDQEDPVLVQNFSNITREEILNSIPDFRFNDVNAKVVYNPSSSTEIDINFYRSEDDLSDTFTNQFNSRRPQGAIVLNREIYSNNEYWTNIGASLNYDITLSKKMTLSGTSFFSQYQNDALTSATLERRFRTEVVTNGAEVDRQNTVRDLGLRTLLKYEINKESFLLSGIDVQNHQVDFNVNERTNDVLGLATEGNELSFFLSWQNKFSSNWQLNTGIRSTYFDLNGKIYVSPRINLVRNLGENFLLKTSFARQYQFVRELTFENLFGRSTEYWVIGGKNNIPLGSSNNYMIGLGWNKGRFSADLEAYFRDLDGVIEFALTNPPFNDMTVSPNGQAMSNSYKLFSGNGQSKGLDLSVSYTHKLYRTYGSYTLSRSINSFRGILGGRDFPAQDDRRHQLKWVNELKFGPLGLSANIIYTSGRPYTDISKLDGNLRRDELTPDQRISRLPHYARFDLGANYNFEIDGAKAQFGISVFNLLNRQNVSYLQYVFSVPSLNNQQKLVNTVIGTQTNQLSRTINFSFKLSY